MVPPTGAPGKELAPEGDFFGNFVLHGAVSKASATLSNLRFRGTDEIDPHLARANRRMVHRYAQIQLFHLRPRVHAVKPALAATPQDWRTTSSQSRSTSRAGIRGCTTRSRSSRSAAFPISAHG